MYLDFYGLSEKPFSATPDPKFLHLTRAHRDALAQLTYGVQNDVGFVLLTGEVGTGKTTLLRTLLGRLDGATAAAFVFNSTLSFDGLLEYILVDFGITNGADSPAKRLVALNTFLIERHRTGQRTVLILDEAQNLTLETLEQIRLLSNFETATAKLLQIVLVGQPELGAKLELPEMRQLQQRIALRFSIGALSPEETREYIHTRLRVAGARDLGLFTSGAIDQIAKHSGGIPRLVNILCDHCLVIGYADQKRLIEPDVVREACAYLDEGRPRTRALRRTNYLFGLARAARALIR